MREIKIEVEPFLYVNYTSFECVKELNEHGKLKITGLMDEKRSEEYCKIAEKETWVKVKIMEEDGSEQIFFHGILTDFQLRKRNGDSILTIEVKTGSYLLDIAQHSRSFQKESTFYADIIKKCVWEAEGNVIILDKRKVATERFLLQYRETDWGFFRRLAGYAETVLIPEVVVPGKKLYFGYHFEKKAEEILSESYDMVRDSGELEIKKAAGMKGLRPSDMTKYVVNSREIYKVGVTVLFQGRKLVVGKSISRLEGGELCHEYHLVTALMGCVCPKHNNKISGISLLAKVVAVDRAKVQVEIREDENKDSDNLKWLDYATVYSTPDGTGWYCMPEIGDEVRLTFPDVVEGNAYVSSSVHLETAGGRSNPDFKSWKNRQNKEVLFTPESLILRNNKGLLLELSDKEGIKLVSDKEITIQAGKAVKVISQNAGVNLSADSALTIKQGCAKIEMNQEITISGGKIYMN